MRLGPSDILSALEKLQLDHLDQDWVSEIWRGKFSTVIEEIPDDYSERIGEEIASIICENQGIIKRWLNESKNSRNSEIIWTSLQDANFKNLVALLHYYIGKGLHSSDLTVINLGFKSAEFYLTLLSIPGSAVFKIFQSTIFETSLEYFGLIKHLKPKSGVRKNRNSSLDEETEEATDDVELSLQGQRHLIKFLNNFLITFKWFLNQYSFRGKSDMLSVCLNYLAEITRTERQASVEVFENFSDLSSVTVLSKNAYLVLAEFCNDFHGSVSETVRLVLYYLLPNFSLIGGASHPEIAKWSNKEQNAVRSIAVWFAKTYILPLGACTHRGFTILIQHLCHHMGDRADNRKSACEMVISLMAQFPEEMYYSLLKWIMREAVADKANHRVVGLELMSNLIYLKKGSSDRTNISGATLPSSVEDIQTCDPSQNQSETREVSASQAPVVSYCKPTQYQSADFRYAMLAIIIDRMRDEAATVRYKALTILEELIRSKNSPTVKEIIKDVFVTPYANLSAIDLTSKEQDFVKWSTFVTVFDKLKEHGKSKTLIPGACKIMLLVLNKRIVEERVMVRKAAISLLAEIFKLEAKWMSPENLTQFGKHCRDPALSVRKEMVSMVTDLMLFYPDHPGLLTLWVEEVVPQISDRELKVQEQVLQMLTRTILANIKAFANTKTATDFLPWKLISHISKLKMRSFLTEACSQWRNTRTGELSQQRIALISSHVGTEHDAAAWALLVSISEYVDIEKPQFVLDHFRQLNTEETWTGQLVLSTLKNCWHKLSRESKVSLKEDFFQLINSGTVKNNLLPLMIEIATAISVSLAKDQETGKLEISEWVLESTATCESHLRGCLQTTISPCEKCVYFMIYLGCLAEIFPQRMELNLFDFIYEFLRKSKIRGDRAMIDLKSVATLTLAKMSLRDGYFASKLVSEFSILLTHCKDPVILNNVVVSIADIGERFPNLIEPLISSLCINLKSPHQSVSEITLVILVDLLQEDYLKARHALIYHLLSLVNDRSPRTVSIIKYYISHCYMPKHTTTIPSMAVQGLFHYNKYYGHKNYPKFEMSEPEEAAFELSGQQNRAARLNIYRFLLAHAEFPWDKMQTINAIVNTILNGVADQIIDISSPFGSELFGDSLQVLNCKELKIEVNKKKPDAEEEEDEGMKRAKQAFHMFQKGHLCDLIIPITCKLRKVLTGRRNFQAMLYRFMRDILKDFKTEIREMFRDDKQFGDEILHEINQLHHRNAADEEEEFNVEPSRVEVVQVQEQIKEVRIVLEDILKSTPKSVKISGNEEATKLSKLVLEEVSKSSKSKKGGETPQEKIDVDDGTLTKSAEKLFESPPLPSCGRRTGKAVKRKTTALRGSKAFLSSTPLVSQQKLNFESDISPVMEEQNAE